MMKNILVSTALLCTPALWATEQAMQSSLAAWQQRTAEYEAAVAQAVTEEAKAAVARPDGMDIAPALWQAIGAKTGTRTEETKSKKGSKKNIINTYEFEEPWAAPAVVWMLNHPNAFAAVFRGKTKQVSFFANALLSSVSNVHYKHPAVQQLCPTLAESCGEREYLILQKIYRENTDKNTRACAALAMSLMLNSPMLAGVEGSAEMTRGKRIYYLKQALLLSDKDADFGGIPITEAVSRQTYYLQHLAVGTIPPRLTVRDMDGKTCEFPEAGKVNLIFFWSPAEEAGTNIVQQREKLEQKNPGLVFVPVIPAATPEQVQRLREAGITTYMDDEDGTAGQAYRVSELPNAVLVNEHARILYNGIPNIELQTVLDTVFRKEHAAAEAAKPKVIIQEAPAVQPGSVPHPADPQEKAPTAPPAADTPAAEKETPPALREMPEF